MMNCVTGQRFGLWLVLASWTVDTLSVSSLENADSLDPPQFNTRELRKTLSVLETSHHVSKRSVDLQKHCDDLVTSAMQLCSKISPYHSKMNPKVPNIATKAIPSKNTQDPVFNFTFYGNATPPAIILSKVTAQRYGMSVEVEFEVLHSTNFYISRINSFDSRMKFVEAATEAPWKESRVWLTLDASFCRFNLKEAQVLIVSADANSIGYRIKVSVDICNFDKPLDEFMNQGNLDSKDKGEANRTFVQVVEKTKLTFLSDPGETILIERGKDPYLEIEMNLDWNTVCIFEYSLWDWESNKLIRGFDEAVMTDDKNNTISFVMDSVVVPLGNSPYNVRDKLFSFEILNEKINYGTETDGKPEGWKVQAKLRVTLGIGSREMSGKLILGYTHRKSAWRARYVAREVASDRIFSLRLPYKISAWPHNTADIKTERHQCDKDGNKMEPRRDKNCTIECEAWGRDIKSIVIVKSQGYIVPIKSTSYVIKDSNAFAVQDLGPANADIEGTYHCTVIFHDGQTRTKDISLVTTGFTKIVNLTFEDLGNSTSRLTCVVFGVRPLGIYASSKSKNRDSATERLDTKNSTVISIEPLEKRTTVYSLLINMNDLELPLEYVTCDAFGERGSDYERLPFK